MPSNLKKMIRARRAKTGEGHQTALRHVRSRQPPSAFEAIVLHIIRLAKERNEERDALYPSGGLTAAKLLPLLFEPMPPRKAALHAALKALPYPVLRKVEVLMYAGRDGIDVHHAERVLRRDEHGVTVLVIAQKALQLDTYLEDGLASAKRAGIDLDVPSF